MPYFDDKGGSFQLMLPCRIVSYVIQHIIKKPDLIDPHLTSINTTYILMPSEYDTNGTLCTSDNLDFGVDMGVADAFGSGLNCTIIYKLTHIAKDL